MHLHQLKIKNLASLRGEHTVAFDQLAGQDLFAITGETGAGKSTLLNSISLALYGEVYKTQLNRTDLITLGEREGSIELIFSLKGTRYVAQWSATVRKKNGEPLAAPNVKRFLYQQLPDGDLRVLEDSPEEVLQLDFDQFSKCVVLNQGEFARFLTASFSERRDILERLYPSDNIDSIGGIAKRHFEEKRGLANTLEVQAHALQEESLFDVEVVKTEEARQKDSIAKVESELKRLRPVEKILGTLLSQTTLSENAHKSRTSAEGQLESATLANNQAMTAWQTQQQALTKFQQVWDKERPTVELHQQQHQELTLWKSEEKNLQDQINDKLRQQEQRQQRLKTLQERIEEAHTKTRELQQKKLLIDHTADWAQVDLRLGADLLRREGLHKQQSEQTALSLQQTESEGKQLAEKLSGLTQAAEVEKSKLPAEAQILTAPQRGPWLQTLRAQQTERKLQEETLQKTQTRLNETVPRLAEVARRAQDSQFLATLLELRQQLVHKYPEGPSHCPVCEQTLGSQLWTKLTSDWDQARASAHTSELQKTNRELEELRTQEAVLKQQLTQAQQRLSVIPPATDLAAVEETHVRLIRLEESLKDTQERVQTCRLRWKMEQEKQQKLNAESAPLLQQIEDWKSRLTMALKLTLPWTSETLGQLQHDQDLYRQGQELLRERSTLTQQVTELEAELKELSPILTNLSAKKTTLAGLIQERAATLAQLYPNSTPSERLRERGEELKALTQKDQLLQNEFRQKERELGEVRARLSAASDQIKQIELLYTQERDKLTPFLSAPLTVSITEAPLLLAPMAQENATQLTHAEQELKAHTEKLAELRTLLEKDRQLREKRSLIKEQQKKLDSEVARYKRLMDVLGQDDLRTYVLSLVEAALIQQTNLELQKLCGGRYEVQHSVRKGKLAPEFWVIDRWRDGLLRKVTTLSGGETFMVSLAMALALAEMTRGKADIDCFFIDEGFGTLDEDSLEGVLEMLQQVQSRGKQIGLITHVKALSNRLPLNLHLQKDSRGNSTVGVVWN